MKEIWKLLELLNEFRPTVSCANFKEHYEFIDDDIYLIREWMDGEEEQFPMYVCYKKGDFVKWLVDNDKIDLKKLDEAERRPMYVTDDMFSLYKIDECVIMLLSISNSPIDDLISYLR